MDIQKNIRTIRKNNVANYIKNVSVREHVKKIINSPPDNFSAFFIHYFSLLNRSIKPPSDKVPLLDFSFTIVFHAFPDFDQSLHSCQYFDQHQHLDRESDIR